MSQEVRIYGIDESDIKFKKDSNFRCINDICQKIYGESTISVRLECDVEVEIEYIATDEGNFLGVYLGNNSDPKDVDKQYLEFVDEAILRVLIPFTTELSMADIRFWKSVNYD